MHLSGAWCKSTAGALHLHTRTLPWLVHNIREEWSTICILKGLKGVPSTSLILAAFNTSEVDANRRETRNHHRKDQCRRSKDRTTLHAIKKLLYCWMRAASRKDGPCGFDAAKRIIIKSNLSFEYRYPKTELCHRLAASCVIPNLKVIGLLSEGKRSNVQHACSSTLPAVASGLGSRRDRIGSFSIFRNTSWDRGRLLRSP